MGRITGIVFAVIFISSVSAFAAIERKSILCAEIGGSTETVVNKATKQTEKLCQIESKGNISAETLYRVLVKKERTIASELFLEHPQKKLHQSDDAGSPAWRYCRLLGGEVESVLYPDQSLDGICQFKDGSKISVWTLYYGPKHSGNRKLTQLLKRRGPV